MAPEGVPLTLSLYRLLMAAASPLAPALRLQALPAAYFPWVAAILIIYCALTQLLKRFYIQRFGKWL